MNEPTTRELNIMIQNLDKNFAEFTVSTKDEFKSLNDKLDKFIEASDQKYSPMAAWSVMKWAGGIVGGILLTAVVAIIISVGINK